MKNELSGNETSPHNTYQNPSEREQTFFFLVQKLCSYLSYRFADCRLCKAAEVASMRGNAQPTVSTFSLDSQKISLGIYDFIDIPHVLFSLRHSKCCQNAYNMCFFHTFFQCLLCSLVSIVFVSSNQSNSAKFTFLPNTSLFCDGFLQSLYTTKFDSFVRM